MEAHIPCMWIMVWMKPTRAESTHSSLSGIKYISTFLVFLLEQAYDNMKDFAFGSQMIKRPDKFYSKI